MQFEPGRPTNHTKPARAPANIINGTDVPDQPTARWNGRFSITITLVTAIELLALISVGGVLGVGVWLAQKNNFALLSDTHIRAQPPRQAVSSNTSSRPSNKQCSSPSNFPTTGSTPRTASG